MKTSKLIIIVLLLGLMMATPTSANTFTGVGSKTTGTFTSDHWTKIIWTTVSANVLDMFSVFVYPQGETSIWEEWFDGPSGTTYMYQNGTYYFDVLTANIGSWSITTSQSDGDWMEDEEIVYGFGIANTKLFDCQGDCQIVWNTCPSDDEFDSFNGVIYDINGNTITDFFDGSFGNTNLYENGTFYINVLAANLNQWGIQVFHDISENQSETLEIDCPPSSALEIIDETLEVNTYTIGLGMVFAIMIRGRQSHIRKLKNITSVIF